MYFQPLFVCASLTQHFAMNKERVGRQNAHILLHALALWFRVQAVHVDKLSCRLGGKFLYLD